MIIGEGEKYEAIKEDIENRKLKNINLLPWQPTNLLPYTFSSADIAIVMLGKEASELSIPSKIYNFLSVGAPILSICPKSSELEKLIIKYDVGKSFEISEQDKILNFINELASKPDLLENYRSKSLEASKDFTPANAYAFFKN